MLFADLGFLRALSPILALPLLVLMSNNCMRSMALSMSNLIHTSSSNDQAKATNKTLICILSRIYEEPKQWAYTFSPLFCEPIVPEVAFQLKPRPSPLSMGRLNGSYRDYDPFSSSCPHKKTLRSS